MSGIDVPEAVEAVTAEWVTKALRSGGRNRGIDNASVNAIEVSPFGSGTAFLGSVARITPTYAADSPAGPTSLILKIPSPNESARTVGRMLNVWVREANFYERLAPLLSPAVKLPTCRFNHVDDATGHGVLLLDDLAPAEVGDQLVGATPSQARVAVEALAKFQSHWWGRPREAAVEWVPGIDNPSAGAGLVHALTASLDNFEARFGDVLPAESVGWNRAFIPRLGQWLTDLSSRPMTIAHADYRLENLMFSDSQTNEVAIIDWQTAMYSGGSTDLAFFLATSLDVDTRRTMEGELIALYIDELVASGVDEELTRHIRTDYRGSMLWWMAMLGNNLATIEPQDDRSRQLFEAMLVRVHQAARDNDAGDLLG